SVRVWLRDPSGQPHEASLEIDNQVRGSVRLTPAAAHDFTAAADLVLDRPHPDARFTVRVAGLERHGRLHPAPGVPTPFTFAFGSCHQPFGPPEHGVLPVTPGAGIFRQMSTVLAHEDARFLALIGDQIYSDGVEPLDVREDARTATIPPSDEQLREQYRWLYRGYFNVTPFRELLESRPALMYWDDHDITEGWGALIDWSDVDFRVFRAAEATYREYQHTRNIGASVDDAATYHQSFYVGNVGFFVLDLRGVRSYAHGRLLGEAQWRALEAFLAEASERETPTLFIVAGIPVVHHAPALVRMAERVPHKYGTDLRDRWSAAPINHERVRFLDLLMAWQCARPRRQVAILSGDVHAGAAFTVENQKGPGRLLQWTSSPLSTHAAIPELVANVVGSELVNFGEDGYHNTRHALVRGNNFGAVRVRPEPAGGHCIELSLYEFVAGKGVRVAARRVGLPAS
ncbi:MAG: alkaline phosphatase D family protein, partial [Chloroflexota bacterium]